MASRPAQRTRSTAISNLVRVERHPPTLPVSFELRWGSWPHALMSVVNLFGRNCPANAEWPGSMSYVGPRAGEEARRQDVGDQALMRGLATAFPNVRPRLSLSYCGHHRRGGHNASAGHSSTVST